MLIRPGGKLASRPLHFIWICDCSGSMSTGGKIQALNNAIRQSLPHMISAADENPNASLMLRCLKFSHGAEWHIAEPSLVQEFNWVDLVADPLQKPSVDIMFMIDTSGSMSGEIEGVKRSCILFADRFTAEGANVRLGLVGFDIGGHRGQSKNYKVESLSSYTIGVWPLTSPSEFKKNISSLSLCLFGGNGCYLANRDTIDIFPHVIRAFEEKSGSERILVIISDEMGSAEGLSAIVDQLKESAITAHVMGVKQEGGAHEVLAKSTGGKFWNIADGKYDFDRLFVGGIASTVARETVKKLAGGALSAGTDMGMALRMMADELKMPPMSDRALPPVLVLVTDGQPTDDFSGGLKALIDQPWGKKAVRIAIAIGKDADVGVLQKFIGHSEIKPLLADNPDALARYMKWVSTAVVKSTSNPPSEEMGAKKTGINVHIPKIEEAPVSSFVNGVW